jgi:hypothetical protein
LELVLNCQKWMSPFTCPFCGGGADRVAEQRRLGRHVARERRRRRRRTLTRSSTGALRRRLRRWPSAGVARSWALIVVVGSR